MSQQPESPFEPNPPDPQVELRKNLFRAVSSFLNKVASYRGAPTCMHCGRFATVLALPTPLPVGGPLPYCDDHKNSPWESKEWFRSPKVYENLPYAEELRAIYATMLQEGGPPRACNEPLQIIETIAGRWNLRAFWEKPDRVKFEVRVVRGFDAGRNSYLYERTEKGHYDLTPHISQADMVIWGHVLEDGRMSTQFQRLEAANSSEMVDLGSVFQRIQAVAGLLFRDMHDHNPPRKQG